MKNDQETVDEFAGLAMQSLLRSIAPKNVIEMAPTTAVRAYSTAHAMLKERNRWNYEGRIRDFEEMVDKTDN
jgi:hypothetical protein